MYEEMAPLTNEASSVTGRNELIQFILTWPILVSNRVNLVFSPLAMDFKILKF
ncbi:24528_t:CDS:2 [Gigaspora margarita]|uniref:24528_t:CDS:1 n=1 Tax=Gigaspora margarita TaxID=4874 RepID=A0ABN7V084_GIGMA|nr:24528_t:CDS:2 [Gigaspora margarita]